MWTNGPSIQAIAWGVIFLFQPLTASFFPVSVLPPFLQHVAYALPPTYVFEAGRQALMNPAINCSYFGKAFGLNIFYSVISAFVFLYLFKKSKDSGQFARNDL
jgi:ABC-2 type transport system permease protein